MKRTRKQDSETMKREKEGYEKKLTCWRQEIKIIRTWDKGRRYQEIDGEEKVTNLKKKKKTKIKEAKSKNQKRKNEMTTKKTKVRENQKTRIEEKEYAQRKC